MLAAAAHALGYPLVLLRLSIDAYRCPRTIGIDGVYSREIVATRGITAGSGTATTELRILLQEMMVEIGDRWSLKLTVKLYVDDLTLAACGLAADIIRLMIEAVDFVVDWLENILTVQVSANKSQLLASKPSIAVAIADGIASHKLTAVSFAKLLGTDSVGGGARRSTREFRRRLAEFIERKHPIG